MSQVLLQLQDENFIVSEDTARQVQKSLPPSRYVTITPITEPTPLLGGSKKPSSIFDKYQPSLTDRQKELAAKITRHLEKARSKPR